MTLKRDNISFFDVFIETKAYYVYTCFQGELMNQEIKRLAQYYLDEAITIRHKIHQFPELGFEEFETAKTVKEFLINHDIPFRDGIAKTGILATIKGGYPGKTVLLRADMDALSLNESPDNPLVSSIPGKMHACGHDGHTAGLCLAGAVLNQIKDKLEGTVLLMFQPAEETLGGAYPMILEGVLHGVDGAFGCHLMGNVLENHAEYLVGPMMAAPDEFSILVKGLGGHGAMPERAIDPIVIASHIVVALQSIVSRMVDPFDPVVLTVGKIESGTAFNIIPNEAIIVGTVRTLNELTRQEISNKIEKIATSLAEGFGASIEFVYDRKYPVLINDEAMVAIARDAFSKVLPPENVTECERPIMGGEDFAYIAQQVPSAFIFVGIAKDQENHIPHHHPSFAWEDHNIYPLGAGLAQAAVDFLTFK